MRRETSMSNILQLNEYAQSVAQTIYEQLGGKRFGLITGSKDFKYLNDDKKGKGITFTVPRGRPNYIDRVKIYLSPLDTYTMEFYSGEALYTDKHNVYVENMLDVFESETGLYATLSPRK